MFQQMESPMTFSGVIGLFLGEILRGAAQLPITTFVVFTDFPADTLTI